MTTNNNWELYAFVISSGSRKKVLSELDTPKTPSEIAKSLKLKLPHVSRALSELCYKRLVKCLTPRSRMGKLFQRTEAGAEVIDYVKKR